MKMPAIVESIQQLPTEDNKDGSDSSDDGRYTIKRIKRNSQTEMKWCVKNRENYSPTTLRQPYGVKLLNNHIITTEGLWPHSRIQVFNHDGRRQRIIGEGQVLPFGVTVNINQDIVITDHHDKTVKCFNSSGEEVWRWQKDKFTWPNGIDVNRYGQYVIADWSKGCVSICDANGYTINQFSTSENNASHTSCPDYLCVDHANRIIVTDAYDQSTKVYTTEGKLLTKITDVVKPKGVAMDDRNNIIVADWGKGTVKMFNSDGFWVKDVVSDDQLQYPLAIDVCGSKLVVTEHKLNTKPAMKLFQMS